MHNYKIICPIKSVLNQDRESGSNLNVIELEDRYNSFRVKLEILSEPNISTLFPDDNVCLATYHQILCNLISGWIILTSETIVNVLFYIL